MVAGKSLNRYEVVVSFAGIIRESVSKIHGQEYMLLLHILMKCNHKDNPDFYFDGKPLPLRRGQLVTSLPTLSKETGYNVQPLRTSLKRLSNLGILTDQSTDILTKRGRLLTIVNIDKFLSKTDSPTDQSTDILTDVQQTPNRPLTVNNNEDNIKKDNTNVLSKERGTRWKKQKLPKEFWEHGHNTFGWSDERINEVYDRFADYWIGVAGQKGVKLDWFATWRNWTRKENEYAKNSRGATASKTDRARDAIRGNYSL